jgi:tRNA-specific 2-thiouridylase
MGTTTLRGDSARGDEYAAVRLVVEDDRIVDAHAPGLNRPLAGLTLLEAAAVPGDTLAADALANALAPAVWAEPAPGRVAVAMSGGVDSAVTLLRALPDAVGVTLRLWLDPRGPSAERACCSPAAVIQAREACHGLGVPHVTLDLRERFRGAVVRPFVDGYAAGETPNPCMRCNGSFRFDELVAFASRVGAGALWTGHYARTTTRGGRRLVSRALDRGKDQTYMLGTVDPALLDRVAFPLGAQTKEETRAEARRAGLAAAKRAESQEACFLAGGDYREFLQREGVPRRPGPIESEDGTLLGAHAGLFAYTPGQRRGLGLASAEPLYVVRTDPRRNVVVVGPRSSLHRTRVAVEGRLYVDALRVEAKLRYRSAPVAATVEPTAAGFDLLLDHPVEAAAPGQFAVLYDDDAVVGAGVIQRGEP